MKIDWSDKTASTFGKSRMGVVYYFRSRFADGMVLAFYSHSPWGRCHNMEEGWVVIDTDKSEIVDEVETKSGGMATGEQRAWMKRVRAEHGKTVETYRNEMGEYLWKMGE